MEYCLYSLAIYKKQTLLLNIDKLIELVAAYPIWSKIDLVNANFHIGKQESSEKWNNIQTTRS